MTPTPRTTRRALLGGTALGLIGAPIATASQASAATSATKPRRPRSPYRRQRFQPLLGKRFRVVDGTRSWVMTLTEVSDLSSTLRGDNRSFGLTLTTRVAGPPQGSYVLRRHGFRPTTLFIVPSDAGRRTYQVVVFRAH